MNIKREISFEDLKDVCWSGAIDTLEKIEEEGKEEELLQLLDSIFEKMPTEVEINDFLRFEDDFIFKELRIEEE